MIADLCYLFDPPTLVQMQSRRLKLLLVLLLAPILFGQNGLYPLESVTVDGSNVSRDTVLLVAGLRMGAGVDKTRIDAGCAKLQASGLFQSIDYRFAPGPKGGVALTLTLADPSRLTGASIDVPGVNESETWDWLKAQFPGFDHKIPDTQGAQEYLGKAIEQHLGPKLKGQRIVARTEDDFEAKRLLISFQPEILPGVASLSFAGEQEISAEKLRAILIKYAQNQGYTDRGFRELVELNLRPAYEEHGMYRVKFPSISMTFVDGGAVAVTTFVQEGPKYNLRAVTVSGDAPVPDELLQAGSFRNGELANWTEIQKGIYATEKPLKRRGYLAARVHAERAFDDEQHLLSVNLKVAKGPLSHFGSLRIRGLPPDMEAKARGMWTMKTGDSFDLFYPNEFLAEFSKKTDLRQFKKREVKSQPAPGDHVMDVAIFFE